MRYAIRLRLLLGIVASLLSTGLNTVAWASSSIVEPISEPVRVAVIDAPVDYDNPDLSAFIDSETLRSIVLGQTTQGTFITLEDYNRAALQEFERGMDKGLYKEQVRVLDLLTRTSAGEVLEGTDKHFLAQKRRKMMFSSTYRRQLNALGTYLHGTHVAGLVLNAHNPEDVKMISFPYIRSEGSEAQALVRYPHFPRHRRLSIVRPVRNFLYGIIQGMILKFTPVHEYEAMLRDSSRKQFAEITRVLKAGRVQVANMSVGFAVSMMLKSALEDMGLVNRLLFGKDMERLVRLAMRIQAEELGKFFADNPQTAFVVAAGNDGVDVAIEGDFHSAAVNAPNVVNVAATDFNGKLADFSNHSPREIEIAAPGVAVRSLVAGAREPGQLLHMSGTSMATPVVANRLVQILRDNPGLTAEQAIDAIFSSQSLMMRDLKAAVTDGRWLIPRGMQGLVGQEVVSISGMDHEIYFDPSTCENALTRLPEGSVERVKPAA